MFEEFIKIYHSIKGSTKPSRLDPLLHAIQAYNQDPTEWRLDAIESLMREVMQIEKPFVKNVVRKYGRAFKNLQAEIIGERLKFEQMREGPSRRGAPIPLHPSKSHYRREIDAKEGRGPAPGPPRRSVPSEKYNPYVTPPSRSRGQPEYNPYGTAPSRPRGRPDRPSSPPLRPEVKEVKRPAPSQPGPRKPKEIYRGIVERKKRAAEEGRRKLGAALETRKAIRELGYDLKLEMIGRELVFSGWELLEKKEEKESKGDTYKPLESGFIWEPIDPAHHQGAVLQHLFNFWYQTAMEGTMPYSFLDWVERWGDKFIEKELQVKPYRVGYIENKDLINYRVTIQSGLFRRLGSYYDTTDHVSISGPYNIENWGIFVQAMNGNIYAGCALTRDQVKTSKDPKTGKEMLDLSGVRSMLHHSCFLRGKPVRCAGEWKIARGGRLISISMTSGHYRPPVRLFRKFLEFLDTQGQVDLRKITVKWDVYERDYNKKITAINTCYYDGHHFYHVDPLQFGDEPKIDGHSLPKLKGPDNPHDYETILSFRIVGEVKDEEGGVTGIPETYDATAEKVGEIEKIIASRRGSRPV